MLDVVVWWAYLVPTMTLFWRGLSPSGATPVVTPEPAAVPRARSLDPTPSQGVVVSRLPVLLISLALLVLGACSAESSGDSVAVTSSDTACGLANTDLPAGRTTFEVTNGVET